MMTDALGSNRRVSEEPDGTTYASGQSKTRMRHARVVAAFRSFSCEYRRRFREDKGLLRIGGAGVSRLIELRGTLAATVLLQPRYPQASYTVPFDEALPGREFLAGQVIALARILQTNQTGLDAEHYLRLPPHDPAGRIGGRQVVYRHRPAVWSYDSGNCLCADLRH